MRHFFMLCALAVSLLSAQQAWSDEAQKKEKVLELIELSGALQKLDLSIRNLIPQIMDEIKANTQKMPAGDETELTNIVAREMRTAKDLYLSGLAPLYEQIFTIEEIQYSIDNYKSPVSQSIAKKMPALIHHSQRMGQEWAIIAGQQATNKVVTRAKEMGYEFKEAEDKKSDKAPKAKP